MATPTDPPVAVGATIGNATQQRVRITPGERHTDETRPLPARNDPFRRWFRAAYPWLVGLGLALAWDRAVYLHVAVKSPQRLDALNSADWYRTLRIVGAPWLWMFVAAILVLYDAGKGERAARRSNTDPGLLRGASAALRRATFLLLSSLLSGAAAEVVKALVGRYKPDSEGTDGYFRFASLHERFVEWKWNDLGLPSSHVALAFGACFAMSILFPRAKGVFLTMAIGCALTRLLVGAHFLSDTYAALLLAYCVTKGVYTLDRRNNHGTGVDEKDGLSDAG